MIIGVSFVFNGGQDDSEGPGSGQYRAQESRLAVEALLSDVVPGIAARTPSANAPPSATAEREER